MPNWTQEQRDAIGDRGHSLIVCAAAGSGKTAVLVERITQLVAEGCPVESMLVVTFTNAAAGEMRLRIGSALEQAARERPELGEQVLALSRASISTLHRFCGNLLREHFQALGVDPAFRIGDEQECGVLAQQAMEDALYACYDVGSADFMAADACFAQEQLAELAQALHGFIMTRPDPWAWLDGAVAACGEGIKTIKMKGGLDPVRDMELMEKLRKAVGPHINILVDANQGYPTAKDAIKWGKRMDRFDLQYLEQPVEGFDQLREVTRMLEVPVCADESCWTPTDALDIVAKHAADYISIYVTKAGGLYPARTVAKIAECAGIRCNVNGSGEFGVGTAANLHMACCGANIDLASVFPITHVEGCPEQTKVAARWYMDDIITKPFRYDDGCLLVPDGPGLGVEIDREKLKKYSETR